MKQLNSDAQGYKGNWYKGNEFPIKEKFPL